MPKSRDVTLFDLINMLRALGDRPIWEVAEGVTVKLVKVEGHGVLVRLAGNPNLGRALSSPRKGAAACQSL